MNEITMNTKTFQQIVRKEIAAALQEAVTKALTEALVEVGVPKLALTLDEAAEASGYSKAVLRAQIVHNYLIPSYANSRPVILVSELRRWLEALPNERR